MIFPLFLNIIVIFINLWFKVSKRISATYIYYCGCSIPEFVERSISTPFLFIFLPKSNV